MGKVIIERPLPQNAEMERTVLGAIIAGHKHRLELIEALRTKDFFDSRHRKLFTTMLAMREAGKETGLLSIDDELRRAGELADVGGIEYLASIGDSVAKIGDLSQTVKRLQEMASFRAIIHAAENIQERALTQRSDPGQLLDSGIEHFSNIARDIEESTEDGSTHFEAATQALLETEGNTGPKIYTDILALDRKTGGFRKGEVCVITASTGVGKTMFGQQIRSRACRDGYHSLYCSGEMFASHLKKRDLAAIAGVPPLKMRREDMLSDDDRTALLEAASHECKKCRILDGELTLARIRRVARKMKPNPGVDLIVLDYDELIECPGKDEFEQQRNLVRAAKSLGMELLCPVILISQLRKSLNGEEASRPTLDRLYGSGAKSKHAQIVIFVDRPFVRELEGSETEAQIFLLKSRDGRQGRIKATFDIHKLRFDEAPEGKSEANMWRNHSEPQEQED